MATALRGSLVLWASRMSRRPPPPTSIADYVRRRQLLSVTDVVAPSWCEYEFQYGVLSQSHLPLAQRPSQIVTPEGNTIIPSYVALQNREERLKAGTGVHDAIERLVHPDQVQIRTATMEDRWALRFIECAAGVAAARHGRAREIPIFGFLHGYPVNGIIDELRREGDVLMLSETKTRATDTLPTTADQRQARIQCMLYRRLYDDLHSAIPLSLAEFARAIGLKSERTLSDKFIADIIEHPEALPWAETPAQPSLADIAALAQESLRQHALPLSPVMELVYVQRRRRGEDEPGEVGRVHFEANESLDAHLDHVFTLLDGSRMPRGVPEALSSRCNRCAWRDGCEWREKQAQIIADDAVLWKEYSSISDEALAKISW
ncbi:hypothetical protein MCUN1_002332 [Malassezia cuniculi]|uniref:Exonuclease V, mitochondrial n=1 Tax=Malassezia cuniculi TaxID=948313 RepID=A0AAF0JBN5_9BASI|nr:hypothetical protein MCUN1_002332 [Malassezia cuniculi]